MSLVAGTRLGPFEIHSAIGVGGMGEVYRATDTNLKRAVAIKVLPEAFASDAERLARFQREAEVLASLNHPNIAAIHGLERTNNTTALVLELVEGPTLADRIAQGPIPRDESFQIATQIAEALEAAHERSIIHRDLKPANIKVRHDGTVKVLDFGLAKALDPTGPISASVTQSPTITSPAAMTGIGVLLGTAAYMAPEQAKGRSADRRSDIWAFGCVLYEMLCGKRAFWGEDVTDTLAAVVRADPDWTALPPGVPAPILRVLRNCLQKDPRWRLQHIGDARLELRAANDPASTIAAARPEKAWWRRRSWAVAAVLSIVSAALGVAIERFRRVPVAAEAIRFTIEPPPDATFATPPLPGSGSASQVAISPDGRYVVFVANTQNEYQLWLRSLDSTEARPLAGTEDGVFPFWSPDSRFIGFFAAGKLKKLSVSGGQPVVLCDASDGRGGTWNRDNVIVFTPSPSGALQRVPASGGTPVDASALDEGYAETNHRFPWFLPDGRHFLFSAVVGSCCPARKPGRIRIGALDSMESVVLLPAESAAIYADGYLLFHRNGVLVAQSFEPSSRTLAGDPVPIIQGVSNEGSRYASVSASTTGVIVYGKGQTRPLSRLTWLDRAGRQLGTLGDAAIHLSVALSPDEHAVAASMATGTPPNIDIWTIDATTGTQVRLTFDPGTEAAPIWSPDSQRVVFRGQPSGLFGAGLFQKAIAGTTSEESLLDLESRNGWPTDWSTDGRYMLYTYWELGGNDDIWMLPLFGERKPMPFLQTAAVESDATFSPDGKWVAYLLREAGRSEVFVQPFPRTGGMFQVSRGGGFKPVWRPDGKELYFITPDLRLMAATIDNTSKRPGNPVALFSVPNIGTFGIGRQYGASRNGQRFLFNVRQRETGIPLTVDVNWMAAMQR